MKKQTVILTTVMTAVIVLTAIFAGSRKTALPETETTRVTEGRFTEIYRLPGQIRGNSHSVFFSGVITSVKYEPGAYVEKGKVLISYLDQQGQQQEIKSEFNCFLETVETDRIILTDTRYHVEASVPQKRYYSLVKDMQGVFSSEGRDYLIRLSSLGKYGRQVSDGICFPAVFSLEETERLTMNQKGLITLNISTSDNVLTVKRSAIGEDDEGYYLIDAACRQGNGDLSKYRIAIEVLGVNDEAAMIAGEMLLDREVLVLNDEIRELLP